LNKGEWNLLVFGTTQGCVNYDIIINIIMRSTTLTKVRSLPSGNDMIFGTTAAAQTFLPKIDTRVSRLSIPH